MTCPYCCIVYAALNSIDGRFDGLDLETGDGSVLAVAQAGSKLGEGWSLETGDGPVTLRIPTNLDAELDARSDDGGIHLDLPVRISGTYDHHEVHGQLNRGGAPLRVRTRDGSIHIGAL